MPADDPILHSHERRLTELEQARLVMDRLILDTAATMKKLQEATDLHTSWLLEHEQRMIALDKKLDRIAELILQGRGGNGPAQ